MNFLDDVIEVFALDSGNLELRVQGFARAIGPGKGTSAPWAAYQILSARKGQTRNQMHTTVGFTIISKVTEGAGVAQRNVDKTMVGKSGHHGKGSRFLTASLGA